MTLIETFEKKVDEICLKSNMVRVNVRLPKGFCILRLGNLDRYYIVSFRNTRLNNAFANYSLRGCMKIVNMMHKAYVENISEIIQKNVDILRELC
jgi:TFIIF-interacting CTD phosphatase-like protein